MKRVERSVVSAMAHTPMRSADAAANIIIVDRRGYCLLGLRHKAQR